MKTSVPDSVPEEDSEQQPEIKGEEAKLEPEPVTKQPEKTETDGQGANSDAGQKVMYTGNNMYIYLSFNRFNVNFQMYK